MIKYNRWYSPWLLVSRARRPAGFSIWPAINTVLLSFTNVQQLSGGHFVGLANYSDAARPAARDAIINTLVYMVVCVPLLTLLPLLLALLVQRTIPFIGFFRTVFYFPVVASAVVVALIWQWLLDTRGLVNGLLQAGHLTHRPSPSSPVAGCCCSAPSADGLEGPGLLHDHLPLRAGERPPGPARGRRGGRRRPGTPLLQCHHARACAAPRCWSRC